ncbi:DUF1653 domain-containing protein [Candidatus Berkelbacteria bacterium]|nr:DUF1653 domain-containing protein [Candidatus Berkelbacteria bacterium]
MTSTIQPGIYEHYKGKEYLVIGTVTHSETRELLVLYTPRYAADEGLVVRPLAMFTEDVTVAGGRRPRFRLLRAVEAR